MAGVYVAPWWMMLLFDRCIRRLMHRPQRIVGPHVAAGATVLDAGCGPGYFSLPMADMVGPHGQVICADIQQPNLDIIRRRVVAAGLDGRVRTVLSQSHDLGVREPVDFALAFYMVHEVPDAEAMLRQVAGCLKPQGRLLVVEPIFHVRRAEFEATVETAAKVGLTVVERPQVSFSRAVLLAHAGHGAADA